MLKSVTAIRFDRRMGVGKTRPCLLTCVTSESDEVEVVAKFSAGCERGVGGLVAEAVTAMLAADLDLPIPEPALVQVDDEFIATVTDPVVANLARDSSRVVFGSTKLPSGFATWPVGKSIPHALAAMALEIFAFDALIQNSDRRPDNPNCLCDGKNFAIYDHELAFVIEGIVGWQPPWNAGALEHFKRPRSHLFYDELHGSGAELNRLSAAWEAIPDARLEQYRAALPIEWLSDNRVAEKTLSYIAQVRDNMKAAIQEIARVLQ